MTGLQTLTPHITSHESNATPFLHHPPLAIQAMRDWVTNVDTTHYIVGSAIGPHPFPTMVRDSQSVIGIEARAQFLEATGKLPDACVACVGGGSNAIGLFYPFFKDESVRLIGVEAGGATGLKGSKTSATLTYGTPGVLHGNLTYVNMIMPFCYETPVHLALSSSVTFDITHAHSKSELRKSLIITRPPFPSQYLFVPQFIFFKKILL